MSTTTNPHSDDHHGGDWRQEAINGGSLKRVHLDTGSNGWASPPGDLFHLRSRNYFTKKTKSPSGPYLLQPAGVDWLRSSHKLDHVLSRPDNRILHALRTQQQQQQQKSSKDIKSLIHNNPNQNVCSNNINNNSSIINNNSLITSNVNKTFILAVNLQVPGRDHHSAVFYFATDEPIPAGSLLYRFINGDDNFRNQRFKLVNRIVKGPWIVKAAVGNYSACLLGKALSCHYYRGENYLEIDVDISSSKIATAILKVALGCVTAVVIDMGFVVEAVEDEELPERLLGAVRVCQMEMASATVVETVGGKSTGNGQGVYGSRVCDDDDGDGKVQG